MLRSDFMIIKSCINLMRFEKKSLVQRNLTNMIEVKSTRFIVFVFNCMSVS